MIGVKCVWRVRGGETGIQSAWKHIVEKRNECDGVVSETNGVVMFFSSISTYQSSKREENVEDQDHAEHESQSSVNTSQV